MKVKKSIKQDKIKKSIDVNNESKLKHMINTSIITTFFSNNKLNKKYLSLVIGVIIIAGFLYYFKSVFVVAVVDGQPIYRLTVIKELEKGYGKQAIDNIITKSLIEKEIKNQKIILTDKDIDTEVTRITNIVKERGQDILTLLKAQGQNMNTFKADLRFQLGLQKIISKQNLSASEKEINDFLEKNKEMLPKDKSEIELKEIAKIEIKQQKEGQKTQEFVEAIKKKAKINYLLKY